MLFNYGVLPILLIILTALRQVAAVTKVPNWLDLSWEFSWEPASRPGPPVPITAQCETIHVTWTPGGPGPSPVLPYYLQIYTSSFYFPFIVPVPAASSELDVTIPFAPGTLYQICMFDSKGSTGGCQDVYTVYQNSTSAPTCDNFTMPSDDQVLNVTSQSASGLLAPWGWIDSCTDLSVKPDTGTPPFTLTVAPALHPPLNITSPDMSAINWTVSLSWASPFFISLVDSTGKTWSNGPLHSGDGKTSCLSYDTTSSNSRVSVSVSLGAAIGGLVLGALAALLATFVISKRRKGWRLHDPRPFYWLDSGRSQGEEGDLNRHSSILSQSSSLAALEKQPSSIQRPRPSDLSPSEAILPENQVAPFQRELSQPSLRRSDTDGSDDTTTQSWDGGSSARTHATRAVHQEGNSQVYVIHHDSGHAPVSVITSRGTEVVELPPGYSADYLASSDSLPAQSDTSDTSQQQSGKSLTGDVHG